VDILIADDDAVARLMLSRMLEHAGHRVLLAQDGLEAWNVFQAVACRCVITDWMMPHLDGLTLCRRIRELPGRPYTYVMALTARGGLENYLAAMEAGLDDCLTKPFDPRELQAKLIVAQRILALHTELGQLQQLLSVCAYCKRVREGPSQWTALDQYVARRTRTQFSHGLCPECEERYLKPQLER
jgi:sigma-B regulation protein RsbU (phosphoserine phosphatase)